MRNMRAWAKISHIYPHLSPPKPCVRRAVSCSAAAPKDSPQLPYKERDDFLRWLQKKTGQHISSLLSVGFSAHGRSLVASQPIQAGDCLMEVPNNAQITSDKIHPELESLLADDIGDISRVAAVLLAEKQLGQHSEWAPYINCLPHITEMHNTMFWSKEELYMVRQSPIYQETMSQKMFIEKEFSAVKSVLKHFPQMFGDFKLEDFMLAYAWIISRAWRTSKGISLIPFADFLNHDGYSNTILLSDDMKETSEVIADQDYAVGEQVMIRYGRFPNATLLLDFGFTLPCNIYDQALIWMSLPTHDPLYTMKLELLHKHCLPENSQAEALHTSRRPFIIKEVKSASGKGKGIPQALRAFARLLAITSHEELTALGTEAAINDGRLARLPLKNTESEIQAHCILLSQLDHMIQGHDSAVKVLDSMDADTNTRLDIRRKMARDLLSGEVQVAKSACAWLTCYCSRLSALARV